MLLISQNEDGLVSARAHVPKTLLDIKPDFGAHYWLETAAKELSGITLEPAKNIRVSAPKGQDKRIMVNMSPVQLSTNDNEKQFECLNKIIKGGNEFARIAWSNVDK